MSSLVEPQTQALERAGGTARRLIPTYELRIEGCDGPPIVQRIERPLIRVGSRQGNDICLHDSAVSRLHFEIESRSDGHCLRDLGSRNGTFVDGYRAMELYLRPNARIRAGATDLVFCPLNETAEVPASPEDRFGELLGSSVAMRELFAVLARAARSDATVLIEGESGTGKELTAQAMHAQSGRATGPFVVFDCASVAESLIESELFGHERGAFTGAEARRIGRLEEADGGTLFLDEIGELPIELQPKLLRALERREFRRVGGSRTIQTNIRLVAATNRDLAQEVNRGAFREDLYYRIAVVRVRIPPLRTRPEDIKPLVAHFLRLYCASAVEAEATLRDISPQTWERLLRHPFRGNVRELRNLVERVLVLSDGALESLTLTGTRRSAEAGGAPPNEPSVDLSQPLMTQKQALADSFERRYLSSMLEQHAGNITRAARAAQIDRMYFKRLMRKHGIE